MRDAVDTAPVTRAAPLTPAERQRRHRAKKKAQAAAFSTTAIGRVVSSSQGLVFEVQALRSNLAAARDKAQRAAEQMTQQGHDLAAARQQLDALRTALRATLPRLTPGSRQQLRQALKEANFIAWLDTG